MAIPASLPALDALLAQPPHHLFMFADNLNGGNVTIKCSHLPTVHLLHDYFNGLDNTWLAVAMSNASSPSSPTMGTLELSGVGKDMAVAVTVVLKLVEGTLGYDRVANTTFRENGYVATHWEYCHTEPFPDL